LKSKINWICATSYSLLSGLIFIKILRLTAENHFFIDTQVLSGFDSPSNQAFIKLFKVIVADEVYILSKLWSTKREEIIGIGKELIRNLISVSKANIPEINAIIEDLAKSHSTNYEPIYLKILDSKQPFIGFNPYVQVNIPPLMEKMIAFILTDVKRTNYIKYFNWMSKKFQIFNESDKSIYIDITRYIVTCFNVLANKKTEYTPRWLILGYLLKSCRNEIFLGEIKQAIFSDWLFFNKERDHILLIEPGALVIFNSAREFPELSMELIEFLEVYSENFDLNHKTKIRENITDAFRQAETVQIIPVLKSILKEERIPGEIKNIYQNLTKLDKEEEFQMQNSPEIDSNMSSPSIEEIESNVTISPKHQTLTTQPVIKNPTEVTSKIRIIQNEFFLHSSLTELISPITWKNFINYRSKLIFKNVLDEICKNFLNKIKSLNLLDFKSINSHPLCVEVYSNFSIFFLNYFKDELISPLETEILEENEKSQITQSNNNVSFYIIDFLISKYLEKNEKELNLITEFVKKIIDNFPCFIVRLLFYFSKKCQILDKSNNNNNLSSNNFFILFSKICNGNLQIMKEKFNKFFEICVENLELETINFVLENLFFRDFSKLFTDDLNLLLNLVQYSNAKSFNNIVIEISSNNYFLVDKILFELLDSSLDLELCDQSKLWSLILSHNNLGNNNLKECFVCMVDLSKKLLLKSKSTTDTEIIEFFKNFNLCLKTFFTREVNEDNLIDYISIFKFNQVLSQYVYAIFNIFSSFVRENSIKKVFSNLIFVKFIEKFLKNIEEGNSENSDIENSIKLINKLIFMDNQNQNRIFLDEDNNSYDIFKKKLDGWMRKFKIKVE